jgi:hypothetical protein
MHLQANVEEGKEFSQRRGEIFTSFYRLVCLLTAGGFIKSFFRKIRNGECTEVGFLTMSRFFQEHIFWGIFIEKVLIIHNLYMKLFNHLEYSYLARLYNLQFLGDKG